jgi:hypothetical protein
VVNIMALPPVIPGMQGGTPVTELPEDLSTMSFRDLVSAISGGQLDPVSAARGQAEINNKRTAATAIMKQNSTETNAFLTGLDLYTSTMEMVFSGITSDLDKQKEQADARNR